MLPRSLPWLLSVLFAFCFLLFVSALILHFVNTDENDFDDSSDIYYSFPYDVHIFSVYYYNNSKSLGSSAISILMTADFEVLEHVKQFELLAISSSDDRKVVTTKLERVTPHDACKWITILTTCQLLPNLSQLLVSLGNEHTPIPFEVVSTSPIPVVMCISPLFASESWQNLLLALHVYKQFGAHMHLYVRSIVSPIYEILKVYETEGYLTLKSWNRIHLLNRNIEDFNPNLNVEFRNQAAAQTDCLLKYKESSDYVAFIDLDDILIPRLANNYLGEFNYFSSENPSSVYFHYSKQNTKTKAYKRANFYTVENMLRSIKFQQKTETGKMIVKPANLNSTWIHWPHKTVSFYTVPADINSITHLKTIEMVDGMGTDHEIIPKYEPNVEPDTNEPLIKEKDIKQIEMDFSRMSWKSSIRRHLRSLPNQMKYSKIIGKCFKETYYKYHEAMKESTMLCPGPERCDLTIFKTKCWNSVGEYHSTRDGKMINIHYVENSDFTLGEVCIT
ncbi:unnamed protein product [Caenorhabditis angaria]|uniref:Glycosyltransferase family 92 protein n=1 Tax=Caenorhabditis angaria TaxID=860376 RepID=A0A9P1I547_9PELO|nr:unnamed protein product [Caenorhabditis angaria]